MKTQLVLKLDADNSYQYIDNLRTSSFIIEAIPLVLSKRWDEFEIDVSILKEKGTIYIYFVDSIKKPLNIHFRTEVERDAFEKEYDQYYDKRWDEMPQIEISLNDWEELEKKWIIIKKERPKYILLSLDDSESLAKVDVVGKDELSTQELQDLKQEHEEYLKWEDAKKSYMKTHPYYSDDVWSGPQDSDYDADIMKYYGTKPEDYPAPGIKKYSKKELALEIKKRVKNNEYPELIGRWLFLSKLQENENFDFEELIHYKCMSVNDCNKTLQDFDALADKLLQESQ